MIGCRCAVCLSSDPRDKRLRPSILVETTADSEVSLPGRRALSGRCSILIDTSTDLRAQALTYGVGRVDAVLFTHSHADHVFGLDEVRRFNAMQREAIPCFADRTTLGDLKRMFSYVFSGETGSGGGVPQLVPFTIAGRFSLGGVEIVPVPVLHGDRLILGFRIGRFAYVTDCSRIPHASWPLLEGVEVLILDALRERPHPTHFSVSEALEVVARVGPAQTFFTHICHDLAHEATCARLPDTVELAYDGLTLTV